MKIGALRVNHLKNPLGFDLKEPVFSWIVLESTGDFQKEARLTVALDKEMKELVYDSKLIVRSREPDSRGTRAEIKLCPRTRYYWQVQVWADDGDYGESPVSWFETGKLSEAWEANWIEAPFTRFHPLLKREFYLEEPVRQARVYVCGLGLYELELNGEKVGSEYLMPGFYDYSQWLQYQTYDVTGLLKKGNNCMGAMLGNGWYKGRLGFNGGLKEIYGDRFQLLCELHITTESGRTMTLVSDKDWLCRRAPVVESSIYDGEIYDGALEIKGWSMPGLSPGGWEAACLAQTPKAPLRERLSPPLMIQERRKPIALFHTPAGELVLDFGQEMTGWVEFPFKGQKGRTQPAILEYGELLQDGNFYRDNLRTAKARFEYRPTEENAWVRPHFTYYGFRYVRAKGLTKEELLASEACVLHSDLEPSGRIETSNPDLNRLFENALWGQKGNFLDVPTDCPQRDERLGWTGDAQVFAATASFNMNTAPFYRKYLFDMRLEQRLLGGSVPDVVPDVTGRIYRMKGENKRSAGACAWGDAATVIPWTMYLFYGDSSMLEEQFENMRLWTDYIREVDETQGNGSRLWTSGFHYGDWLALDHPDPESRFGKTDCYYVASAYYYYSASLTALAAKALGKETERKEYEALAGEIREAFCRKYYTGDGTLKEDTQTALVMALYLDLIPRQEGCRERLIKRLKEKLDSRGIHLDTGFVGTPWLCPVLSLNGLKDYAYTLLLQEDYPSWLYEVRMGATTVWERWNSVLPDGNISGTGMNSLNHYAYGAVVEWMYRYLCGINPLWEEPGFKKALICPQTDSRLKWAWGTYDSAMGRYSCRWERQEARITYEVEVPFGARARFVLEPGFSHAEADGAPSKELETEGSLWLRPGKHRITASRE